MSFAAYMYQMSGTLANGKICVKKSTNPEAGLGLFAATFIPAGQIITVAHHADSACSGASVQTCLFRLPTQDVEIRNLSSIALFTLHTGVLRGNAVKESDQGALYTYAENKGYRHDNRW